MRPSLPSSTAAARTPVVAAAASWLFVLVIAHFVGIINAQTPPACTAACQHALALLRASAQQDTQRQHPTRGNRSCLGSGWRSRPFAHPAADADLCQESGSVRNTKEQSRRNSVHGAVNATAGARTRNSQKPKPFGCPSEFLTSLHAGKQAVRTCAMCATWHGATVLPRALINARCAPAPARRSFPHASISAHGRGACAPEADNVADGAEDVLELLLCGAVRNVAHKHRSGGG